MARGKAHSDDIRAQVIAAILAGEGVSDISRRLQLPKATVSRLRNEVAPEKLEQVGTEKREEVNDLICNYLAKNFRALESICEVLSDASYLRQHSPQQLASVHEELSGKAFQIIEAEPIVEEPDGEEGNE